MDDHSPFDDGDAYIVLITPREMVNILRDPDEGFESAIRRVLGVGTLVETSKHLEVNYVPCILPDAVGPGGELVCRL